ncbi:MAG: hypothetical protein JWN65_1477 [Solirubrobacterales bacterium]|nr:hypothetical protein [Solirubrobacterales bacterium]
MLGRPRRTLGVALLLFVLSALAATQLPNTPATSLLVDSDTKIATSTDALTRQFGQEPIAVVLRGDLRQTLSAPQLVPLLALEADLSELKGVQSVYGPGTFLNQTVKQTMRVVRGELGAISRRADADGAAARSAALQRGASTAEADAAGQAAIDRTAGGEAEEYKQLLVRFGAVGLPSLTNRGFINTLVFGTGVEPKARFRWLFPDAGHALILVRPNAGVSGAQMLALGEQIKRLARTAEFEGTQTRVAGLPLLAAALERETRSEILRLAPIAVVGMLLLLLVVLRRRRGRLISLGLALGSLLLCMGFSWPLGLGLTVSTVAALPVILGLGLDFAVQMQARYWIERDGGHAPRVAAAATRRALGPTLGLAAGAMSAGFLVLLVGPVPLIDRLGAVLALGTVCAVAVALLAGPALLMVLDRGVTRPLALPALGRLSRASLSPALLGVVALLALAGLAVSDRVHLQSDLAALAPRGLPELVDAQGVQKEVGTSGQIAIAVRARDVTDPRVVAWVGRVGEQAQRADRRLRAGPNLADLVTGGDATATVTRAEVNGMLRLLPPYFLDAVVSKDRRIAELTYAVPFVSVAEQGRIVRRLEAALRSPPPGVTVSTAGLVAESATSTRELDRSRPDLLLLGAAVIAAILFAFWRDVRRVALVLAPALLAAGLSSLVLALAGLTLSPLAAALEPLVLAIGLEFGMLLDMSFRQARARGASATEARIVATRDVGGAVGLSAATVAVGFTVLGASRLPLLAQLGWLVALELVLCLVIAVIVVPMVSEWMALPSGTGRARRRRFRTAPVHVLRPRRTSR